MIKLIECPRDAMQGLMDFVPTFDKITYLNTLLKVGFDTLDFGSFVSPKAIPQLRDTAEVLAGLDLTGSETKLLAIVANLRGARDAFNHEEITYLGYPFSISETFQLRNTNTTIADSQELVLEMQEGCLKHDKQLVVYLSMGFGNPYNDPFSIDIIEQYTEILSDMGISIISISDTVGNATNDLIKETFEVLSESYPHIEFGVHLHARKENADSRLEAAFLAGCKRFDSAIRGFGGCPMAKDDLVGNVPTEILVEMLERNDAHIEIDKEALGQAIKSSHRIFN